MNHEPRRFSLVFSFRALCQRYEAETVSHRPRVLMVWFRGGIGNKNLHDSGNKRMLLSDGRKNNSFADTHHKKFYIVAGY